jgi:hypothetical protein
MPGTGPSAPTGREAEKGVQVYTTSGNQWAVANGGSFTQEVTPTGELAVLVFSVADENGDTEPLFACGSVEAVYADGAAVMTPPVTDGPAASRAWA